MIEALLAIVVVMLALLSAGTLLTARALLSHLLAHRLRDYPETGVAVGMLSPNEARQIREVYARSQESV